MGYCGELLFPVDELKHVSLAFGIIHLITIPIAIVLNTSVIINIIFRRRLRRNITNSLIFNLCVADLILILSGEIPFACILFNVCPPSCQIGLPAAHIAVNQAFIALFFLNLDRYIAIFHPYARPRLLTKQNIAISIAVTWFIPGIFAVLFYLSGLPKLEIFIAISAADVLFVSFLVFFNSRAFWRVRKIQHEINADLARFEENADNRSLLRRSRGSRLLALAVILLCVCYLPFSVKTMLNTGPITKAWFITEISFATLACFPAFLNVIIIIRSVEEIRRCLFQCPKPRDRELR